MRARARKRGLRAKFAILFACLIAALLCFNAVWSSSMQRGQIEREMLGQAELLAHEMDAVWDFMERNQNQFVRDDDGGYRLYCVVAAKSISRAFTRDTDCVVHYTNVETRKGADAPDDFELEALEAFRGEGAPASYYALTTDELGAPVFRYCEPLFVTESCLECHGQPAGEIDPTGYPKEGQQIGDVAGIVSIIMPAEIYYENAASNVSRDVAMFAILIVACVVVTYAGMSRLVIIPLRRIDEAAVQLEAGDFDVDLSGVGRGDEIENLSTHFAAMSAQLGELYGGLESQVEQRTSDLECAYRQLEEANSVLETQRCQLEAAYEKLKRESEYKSDFLAIMSHELKTPLTSILAFADILEREQACGPDGKLAFVEIRENGQALLQMVNNILSVARAEAGKLELSVESVDIVDLLATVEGTIGPIAARRSLDVSFSAHPNVPVVSLDYEKTRRIVENLVSNAVKFTEAPGSVRVVAFYDDEREVLEISVSDTGIGIDPEFVSSIFNRFAQGERSSSRRYGGSGLGLAVVKELVELHGGSVTVESVKGEGSTFTVLMPAKNVERGVE